MYRVGGRLHLGETAQQIFAPDGQLVGQVVLLLGRVDQGAPVSRVFGFADVGADLRGCFAQVRQIVLDLAELGAKLVS